MRLYDDFQVKESMESIWKKNEWIKQDMLFDYLRKEEERV